MKRPTLIISAISTLLFFAIPAAAQYDEAKKGENEPAPGGGYVDKATGAVVRPGMELRRIGGLNLLVPEGTQLYKDRSQWIMEEPEAYAARNITELKGRIEKLEASQKALKEDFEKLKEGMKAKE